MEVFHLLYSSVPVPNLALSDISDILAVSNRKNQAAELTGILLLRSNRFLQLLEGSERNVRSTYDRIILDSRHDDAEVVMHFTSPNRIFPLWAMGYPEHQGATNAGDKLFANVKKSAKVGEISDKMVIKILMSFNRGEKS